MNHLQVLAAVMNRFAAVFTLIVALYAAPDAQASPAKIASVVLSRRFDGTPRFATTTFAPTDRTFHAFVRFDRSSSGDVVKVAWIIVNAGGVKNYRFAEKTLGTRRMNALHFSTSAPKTWPHGQYRIDVFLNQNRARQVYFAVK